MSIGDEKPTAPLCPECGDIELEWNKQTDELICPSCNYLW